MVRIELKISKINYVGLEACKVSYLQHFGGHLDDEVKMIIHDTVSKDVTIIDFSKMLDHSKEYVFFIIIEAPLR